jgi:2',3'-cyclic-nucleotide 2'-phosphodiesterase (5'-nucleotidase family)
VLDGLKDGPLLVLDSGNALFGAAGVSDQPMRERARFILDVMGRLGTRAMAVGVRDLSGGIDFLKEASAASGVKLLSANLKKDGKPVFDATATFTVGGVTVGVVGLTAPGPVPDLPGVSVEPTLPAAKAALKTLGIKDVTILLAATPYADALQLAQELKSQVDFVIQSGEFRGTQPPQRIEGGKAYVLASAQRGQALSKLELDLGPGAGAFVDLSAIERDKQQLAFVDTQIKTLDDRIAVAKDPAGTKDLKATRELLRERRKALQRTIDQQVPPKAKTMKQTWIILGADVRDDEAIKAEVLKYEPTYSGAH